MFSLSNFDFKLSKVLTDPNALKLTVLHKESNVEYITLLKGNRIQDFNFALEKQSIIDIKLYDCIMELSLITSSYKKLTMMLFLLGNKNTSFIEKKEKMMPVLDAIITELNI